MNTFKPISPSLAYYAVEILERDGTLASRSVPAQSVDNAMAIVRSQVAGNGDEVKSAKFCDVHPGNRMPGSVCKAYRATLLVNGDKLVGVIHENGTIRPLDPRPDLADRMSTGFAWGFDGFGPAHLSLALLADALGDDRRALHLHERFKIAYIAELPMESGWLVCERSIARIADILEQDKAAGLPFTVQPPMAVGSGQKISTGGADHG